MVRFIFSFLFADPMSVTDSKKSSKWPPWSSDIYVIVSLQQFLGEEKSNNTYFFLKRLQTTHLFADASFALAI